MSFLNTATQLLSLGGIVGMANTNRLTIHSLLSINGAEALLAPSIPILLAIEFALLLWIHRRRLPQLRDAYEIPTLNYFANTALLALAGINAGAVCYLFASRFAPFTVPVSALGFLYVFAVYSLGHYLFHYSCHKVRFLWCLHSPHHAPRHMNLSVYHASFYLHGSYATGVRAAVCGLLGVPLPLLILTVLIDETWGAFIHIGHEVWPRGEVPFLRRFIMMPSHHRVHHARNPEYIDKNYCNTLPLWDKVFGTLQDELPTVKPEYGINRNVDDRSLIDTYCGEFLLLLKDIRGARSIKEAAMYLFKPPGWCPAESPELVAPFHAPFK
jgi:sterol desaturase/sphingolipid hydroxylase (fatty acid hydroxylase superfamily)